MNRTAEMQDWVQMLVDLLARNLPPGWQMVLCCYDAAAGDMAYFGTGKRADTIKLLRELADKLEADTAAGGAL